MAPRHERWLIRADGSPEIGTGHVMRCLALSQALQEAGGEAVLATTLDPGGLGDRLASEGIPIRRLGAGTGSDEDALATATLARELRARWVVVDGYRFSGRYQRLLKEAGCRVLAVDDYGHAEHYWADVVLNQNLHASEALYRDREPGVRLLLGPRFALLRREYGAWRAWERSHPPVARKILVTFGGSDPENVTAKAAAALARVPEAGLEASVVVGASCPHLESLRRALEGAPHVRLLRDVRDMAGTMARADLAVSAGGSTSWELAYMGLPALTVVLAENQVDLADGLAAHGVARNLGWHQALTEATLAEALAGLARDQPARRAMGARGRELVDGDGGRRVVRALMEESA